MTVNIKIGEWAAKYSKTGEFPLKLPKGATVEDVMHLLNLPQDETGFCAVANKHVARGHELKEGDDVKFFPCIVGG